MATNSQIAFAPLGKTIVVAAAAAAHAGTAAPATGTWFVGDRVQNSVPTAGQPKAWSCNVSGTPGTWVSEGKL